MKAQLVCEGDCNPRLRDVDPIRQEHLTQLSDGALITSAYRATGTRHTWHTASGREWTCDVCGHPRTYGAERWTWR